ncbi:MAG: carbon storage regulator CsrA [Limisphaerales bacterium]
MLILCRKINESIVIDGTITVKVLRIDGDQVRLGIQAPSDVPVHRHEIYEEIQKNNREAATHVRTDLPRLPAVPRPAKAPTLTPSPASASASATASASPTASAPASAPSTSTPTKVAQSNTTKNAEASGPADTVSATLSDSEPAEPACVPTAKPLARCAI